MKIFNSTKINFWVASTPLFLSLFMVIFLLIISRFLPPRLPLFYSLPWGEKQLASQNQLLIIPASIALISLCNLALSWHLHSSQIFFKTILLLSSLQVSLILTITFFKVIFIFI